MRAIIAFLVVTLSFLAFTTTANAQLFNRLKDRAKKAAENKVEEKISNEVEKAAERAVEKSWQSIFGEEFGSEGDGINVSFTMNSNAATKRPTASIPLPRWKWNEYRRVENQRAP